MFQIIQRLAQNARIERARMGPYTFRHTFAVNFLRDGGREFTLMHILGHTRLHQTRKNVQFVQADIAVQQRLHSPRDRLKE
jgi:integrase/recombinase XerD